ncbi:hypothetical protein ACFLYU_05515 [Candidatus Dependentiae bacterium]
MDKNFYKLVFLTICALIIFSNKMNAMKKSVLAFSIDKGGEIMICDIHKSGKKQSQNVKMVINSGKRIKSLQFNPKESHFLLSNNGEISKIWDIKKKKLVRNLKAGFDGIKYNPVDPRFLISMNSHDIKILDLYKRPGRECVKTVNLLQQDLKALKAYKHKIPISMAIHPAKPNIIVVNVLSVRSSFFAVVDTNKPKGKEVVKITSHRKGFGALVFQPLKPYNLFFGGGDGKIRIFNIYSKSGNELIETLDGHSKVVEFLQFNPKDPKILVSGSKDEIKVWDLSKLQGKKCIKTIKTQVDGLALDIRKPNIIASAKITYTPNLVEEHGFEYESPLYNFECMVTFWDISQSKGQEKIKGGLAHKGTLFIRDRSDFNLKGLLAFQPPYFEKKEEKEFKRMLFEQQKVGTAKAKLIEKYKKGEISKNELEIRLQEIKDEYSKGVVRIRKGLRPYTSYKL